MKTNMTIELNDTERKYLAALIDNESSRRMATRIEVTAIAKQHFGGLVAQQRAAEGDDADVSDTSHTPASQLYKVSPEDAALLRDRPWSYIRGWNAVKNK